MGENNNIAIETLAFEDLFNLEEVQHIQDAFAFATGVGSLIVKPDGTPITKPSNFCGLCTYIRGSKLGEVNCHHSDAIIGQCNHHGPIIQRCLSGGLLDAGAPIIANGQHICSWLIGQVIDEAVPVSTMEDYARTIDVDQEEYSQHLVQVKRMSQIQFNDLANFLFLNAKYLSTLASQKLALTQEISIRTQREAEILYMSYHDVLTGLYNRRFFEEELKRLDTPRNYPLTMVMGDLNGLKLVNDSFGHNIGDQLLIKCAVHLQSALRSDDIIARLGGDEFIFIFTQTEPVIAEAIISRIKDRLIAEQVDGVPVSIAFGQATKFTADQSIDEVLRDAEASMYRNKLFMRSTISHGIIDMIMSTLFAKNEREIQHSNRVADLSQNLAKFLGFDQEAQKRIYVTALMHDIGKIGIDDAILNCESSLNDKQWLEIKKHPEIGYRILSASNEFYDIANDVLQHHERWDGSGYPKGLRGNEISTNARIIALADAFDAMLSIRPCRKPYSLSTAIEEIQRCTGTQFDPNLAKLFVEMLLKQETNNSNIAKG